MTPQERVKLAFQELVSELKGVEAVGAILKLSPQRVSQCQVLSNTELPSLNQILKLEALAGKAIVSSEMARLVEAPRQTVEPLQEACDVTDAAAKLMALVRADADPKAVMSAVQTIIQEALDVHIATTTKTS